MDPFLKRFLAKNKYPEILDGLETLEAEYENLSLIKDPDSENANLILTLQNLGLGATENLDKAEQWALQLPVELSNLCLLLIIYIRNSSNKDYTTYRTKYRTLMDKLQENTTKTIDNEFLYRFLRLLAGWCRMHADYELSQDLLQLSNGQHDNKQLEFDQMINRWLSIYPKVDLRLISLVIGPQGKLDYFLAMS